MIQKYLKYSFDQTLFQNDIFFNGHVKPVIEYSSSLYITERRQPFVLVYSFRPKTTKNLVPKM